MTVIYAGKIIVLFPDGDNLPYGRSPMEHDHVCAILMDIMVKWCGLAQHGALKPAYGCKSAEGARPVSHMRKTGPIQINGRLSGWKRTGN